MLNKNFTIDLTNSFLKKFITGSTLNENPTLSTSNIDQTFISTFEIGENTITIPQKIEDDYILVSMKTKFSNMYSALLSLVVIDL